jgi:hypothetical protein
MNSPTLVKQGSTMWQGVMKAWGTIQSGLEQQNPSNWSKIIRQPLFGNQFLTNELGVQWGKDPKTNIRTWAAKGFKTLQDIATADGYGWKTYPELLKFRRSTRAPPPVCAISSQHSMGCNTATHSHCRAVASKQRRGWTNHIRLPHNQPGIPKGQTL